ncbi:hypothetical protein Ari01nite_18480 [Paractinoplanes rishiriensis]|uniref:Tetratricopeptide repeat protein n=2 Tax=Paractinoplanes rishiriensis TaxID=1050105 RepID=A0A919JWF3_9ACTN|nr:hypothetical protein Ari01nite_18480 [Actinoplanes rishiriensis]
MNVFVLSHRCGHCVHRQVVTGVAQYETAKRGCVGKPCPVCGTRPRAEDDLQMVAPDDQVDAVGRGMLPWDRSAGSVGHTVAHDAFARGDFAQSLRQQMSSRAGAARKAEFQALSTAFAGLLGFPIGNEAYERRDFGRALVWLTVAAAAVRHPTEVAACHLYLGLTRAELGDLRAAATAFDTAAARTDADPVVRAIAADQLGTTRKALGDLPAARAAYQLALDLGAPSTVDKAGINLGTLEDEAGNQDRAHKIWERVHRTAATPEYRAYAAHNLGWHWEQAGDPGKAYRYYREAASGPVPEVVARASDRLRVLPPPRRRFFGRDR